MPWQRDDPTRPSRRARPTRPGTSVLQRNFRRTAMVHGVSVVWLPVSDIGKAVDFYSGTLGLETRNTQDEWAELEANGLRVGLNARDEETPSSEGGAVLAFQPEGGVDGAVADLKDKGVE